MLQTERLLLRPLRESDMPAFAAYRADPEVSRYQSWIGCSEEEARSLLEEQRRTVAFAPGTWLQLAMELQGGGALVGDCAVHVLEDARLAEIGFTLAPAHQGRGYATEAVRAVLDHLFAAREAHRVSAVVDARNAPSVALLERVGMRREAHFVRAAWFKGEWADEYVYAVLRDEWTASPAAG